MTSAIEKGIALARKQVIPKNRKKEILKYEVWFNDNEAITSFVYPPEDVTDPKSYWLQETEAGEFRRLLAVRCIAIVRNRMVSSAFVAYRWDAEDSAAHTAKQLGGFVKVVPLAKQRASL